MFLDETRKERFVALKNLHPVIADLPALYVLSMAESKVKPFVSKAGIDWISMYQSAESNKERAIIEIAASIAESEGIFFDTKNLAFLDWTERPVVYAALELKYGNPATVIAGRTTCEGHYMEMLKLFSIVTPQGA